MKKRKPLFWNTNLSLILLLGSINCNKYFDAPPAYLPPDVSPNESIAQLKAQHIMGSYEVIANDDIIAGIVVANDSSGSFYKQIIIEDTSAGIAINIDDYNLYTSYPEGRQVFIKLKGLILYDDNKLIEIGGSKDGAGNINPIAAPLKEQHVIRGTSNNMVEPKTVDISELNDSHQNMLIRLEDLEFSEDDTSKLYADTSPSKNSASYIVRNCSNKSITLRNSGFAFFAGAGLPNGNGSIDAIYSVYNSAKQIVIRDTGDVRFNGTRCNGGEAVLTTIANIRSMYHGTDIKLGAYKIAGVVISDAASKNIATGSVVLQDGDAGIAIYFGGTIAYSIGDSIVLDVSSDSLQNYNGSLEIKTASGTLKPSPLATGRVLIPRLLNISQVKSDLSNIEHTLIRIVRSTASGGTTYSGSRTLTDASGSITLFTSSTSSFANNTLPTDTSDWIGYAKFFGSTSEFQIRNTGDVKSSTGAGGSSITLGNSPFTLNFDDLAAGLPGGVLVKLSASATSPGIDGAFSNDQSAWSSTSSGFKNFAGATGLTSTADAAAQNASTNRALGVKQTGTTGFDPGAAFVFKIDNTSGRSNFVFHFSLQSLDENIGRNTTWQVDYALGDDPTEFIQVATSPPALATGPQFSSIPVSVSFGNALDNKTSKVWIRVVTLGASTGTGSRASSAIDDVQISWD